MQITVDKFGWIGIALVSFFATISNTIIGRFFEWISFGLLTPVMSFANSYYAFLIPLFSMLIFLKWTRNVYLLMAFAVGVWAFMRYALNPLLTPLFFVLLLPEMFKDYYIRFFNSRRVKNRY